MEMLTRSCVGEVINSMTYGEDKSHSIKFLFKSKKRSNIFTGKNTLESNSKPVMILTKLNKYAIALDKFKYIGFLQFVD